MPGRICGDAWDRNGVKSTRDWFLGCINSQDVVYYIHKAEKLSAL